jgi:hypothetical protein
MRYHNISEREEFSMDRISSSPGFTPAAGERAPSQPLFSGNEAMSIMKDAEKDPEILKLHAEILDLESRKSSLDFIMKKPREQWPESYRVGAPALYNEVKRGVAAKEQSTAFRITAFTWLAGSASAMGSIACAFIGGPVNVLGFAFIAALGIGTGAGRLYQWAAHKWIIPKKIDKVMSELVPKQHAILERQLEADRKLEKEAVQRYVIRQGSDVSHQKPGADDGKTPAVQEVDDEVIDVAGVKLKINQQSGLVQSIPMNIWGRALYTNS